MNTNNGMIAMKPFSRFMDDFFNRSISDIVGSDLTHETPAVNIIETNDSFELEVAAPGLDKEDFNVTVEKDYLSISAERKQEMSKDAEENGYKRREYNYQKFMRRFRLPATVNKESLEAKYKQGILYLTIQKTPEAKKTGPRSIDIK